MIIPEEEIRKILYRYRGQIDDKDMDEILDLVNSQSTKILEQQKELDLLHKLNKAQSDRDKQESGSPVFRMFRD